ncbi:unnamed protein product [Larinioides sclopetarius]|uniref:Cytochrome P450 n=1 Tax=Larinioides sclopetarius TaxID=280406 RepID=A0AAV2AUG7_9ARAC
MLEINTLTWILVSVIALFTFLKWYVARNDDYWRKRGIPYQPRMSFLAFHRMLKREGMASFIKRFYRNNLKRVYGLFGAFTMDVIANSAFGTHIDSHNDPNNEFVRRARRVFEGFNFALIFLAMAIPSWIWKCLPSNIHPQKFDRNDFFRDVTRNVIKKRKETGREEMSYDAVREMKILDAVVSETLRMYPPLALRLDFLLSSLDDDSLLLIMLPKQSISSNLTKAIRSLHSTQTRSPGSQTGNQCDNLMKIGVVRWLERTAVENYELRNTGIVVEKGMRVMIPIYGMHYDPEFFEDPEIFNPERFLEDPKHPQYAYMPFGSGPRNCIGMRFALLEIKVCLSNLLRHFRLKPHSNTKIPLDYRKDAIFLTVAELPLLVEKRTDVKYVARNDDYWRKKGIPYRPRMSFLALQLMLKREGMVSFIKSFYENNLGRAFGGFEGAEPIVVVTEPDLLRDILVKDFHIFPYRRVFETGDPVGDNGLTNLTGEQWKRIRTIITPAFTSKRMRQCPSLFFTIKTVFSKQIYDSLFGAFTMDVIANSAFGTQIDSHNDPNNEFVRRVRRVFEGFNFALMFLAMAVPAWIWKCIPSKFHPLKFDRDDFFREVTRNVIKKRKETGREEMSYDAVREMKILDAVISETLRMHPPIATLERSAVENYALRNTGIVVEKGMRVMIPIYGMHYDPEFFEDPEIFNPERFLEDPKHPQYAYLPFGSGPRNCLGMRFALLEIKVCLSNLLHHFRLKPHSNTKIPLEYRKDAPLLTLTELPLLVEKRTDVQ